MRTLTSKSCYLPILSVLTFFLISPPASDCRKIRESRTSLRHLVSLFSSLCIIPPLADFYQRLIILPIFHAQAASKVTPPHTQDLLSFNGFWGARDGAVVRALASHQCGPGSNPGIDAICGLSLLLVLSLAREVFLRVLRFPPLLKTQHF